MTDTKPTGTCLHCGRTIGITKGGSVRMHGQEMQRHRRQSTQECHGSFIQCAELATDEDRAFLARKIEHKKQKQERS